MNEIMEFTPKEIVKELDKYIISQKEAKKSVAISLKNRDRRKKIKNIDMRREITPKNVILVGPTGVGKTEIARRIAKLVNAPFIKIEATKYTEIGYVGKDVESIIRDLTELTYRKMKEDLYRELRDQSYDIVLETIAKKLNPYNSVIDSQKKKLIQEIKDGIHDDVEIEIERKNKSTNLSIIEIIGGGSIENVGIGNFLENVMGSFGDFGKDKFLVTVKEAIKKLIEEDIDTKINTESLKSKVIENVENNGIVFIDEIDKIAERSELERGEVSRQGVQRDILPIVEGSTIVTSLGPVRTDHILFIAAGAFTQSSPSDLMPELQGRFPIQVKLKNLEKSDFIKILTEVEYNLIEQYQAMLATDNVELLFEDSAIDEVSKLAVKLNENIENVGARRLSAIIEEVLRTVMYEAPYKSKKKIIIDRNYIQKLYKKEKEKENFDKFIL